MKSKYEKYNFTAVVLSSKNIMEVVRALGMKAAGGNHGTIKRYIKKYGISTSHFETAEDRARLISHEPIPLEAILVENSTYDRTSLKARLYKTGLKKRECELCGQGEEWKGKHMSLILDHVNGVNNDNRLPNLRIVCPNCAATLDTHCGKQLKQIKRCIACKNVITRRSTYCRPCSRETEAAIAAQINSRKVKDRPSLEQLRYDIKTLNYVGTGKKYGVSDTAIRKWEKTATSLQ